MHLNCVDMLCQCVYHVLAAACMISCICVLTACTMHPLHVGGMALKEAVISARLPSVGGETVQAS